MRNDRFSDRLCCTPTSLLWPDPISRIRSSVTSTGLMLWPASDSRRWCRSSRPSTEPSTSRHRSGHIALLHQRAGWYRQHRANKARSVKSRLFFVLEPQDELPTNVSTAESFSMFSKTQDSLVHTSPPQSMTPSQHLPKRVNATVCSYPQHSNHRFIQGILDEYQLRCSDQGLKIVFPFYRR